MRTPHVAAAVLLAAALAAPVVASEPWRPPAPGATGAAVPGAGTPASAAPVPAPSVPGRARGPNPHDRADGAKADCQACHERPGQAAVRGDPIALCAGCHDPAYMKHPFRVMVKGADPAGLPLMTGGFVACHTCHDPHAITKRKAGLRLEYTELCLRCHARHAPTHAKPPGHPGK
ncbi:cytochrome c3 family protein [Anaeromyxobacter oryzae]|uniref:Doubled CXXCH motif domain-containing protein n=1 Tax=Anaeromyxobacter oryzae TaxID=2918170 RepID=A0ABN6N0W3_9BACT|nr:cytochrome c3 family protein [Anaeromyxobacter oryzae]BDG06849.1 hypothetical protein AMOR_58450 [Anaeromyxobacter oryzae]